MKSVKPRVLIASSNTQFLSDYRLKLKQNYQTQWAQTIEMADFLLKEWLPQALILDDSMKGQLSLWHKQQDNIRFGIMMIAENLSESEEVSAFHKGADHVISTKASEVRIFSRLDSLIRRITDSRVGPLNLENNHQSAIKIDKLSIRPRDYLLMREETVIPTTPTQFHLLMTFLNHPDQLLSRAYLKDVVWDGAKISPRSIDAHISKLKKLVPEVGQALSSIYGKGYILYQSKLPTEASHPRQVA